MATKPRTWKDLATQLRADSIRATTEAGSGHPTSCLSAADLMAVLLHDHLHTDFQAPRRIDNDRLIFSKGHAAPLLYAMLKAAGAISDAELLTLRKFGSPLEGHPSPRLPYVEVATGSLGQGLPAAVGMALAAKRLQNLEDRFWVLLGDSEMAEGSNYEAFELAAFYGLSNVIAILDMNRLGQRGPTMLQWDGESYAHRARAFGWDAVLVDGHDVLAIHEVYKEAERTPRPTLVVAKTKKGAGVSLFEDKEGWHGKPLSPKDAERALAELGYAGKGVPNLVVQAPGPRKSHLHPLPANGTPALPSYAPGASVATRAAFGEALAALGTAYPRIVALDAEVGNSTGLDTFGHAHPERFFEMYIAEQQLVSAAVGMQVLGWIPFASTFAAFFARAGDQVRMAAISQATIHLVGSHCGVSIGEDGPSQMGLEDLSMMRAVHGSTVLYPSCANATAKLVEAMATRQGIHYLRTTREKTAVLYGPDEDFPVGGSKTLRQSDQDTVAILAAGITVHEALKAYEALDQMAIRARVIDLYSVKPIDRRAVQRAARACSAGLVVVEDHHPEGGLGDAVAEVFDGVPAPSITRLAVRILPGSGKPAELMAAAGIDAGGIVDAVTRLTHTAAAE